jgi:hypothetical protein
MAKGMERIGNPQAETLSTKIGRQENLLVLSGRPDRGTRAPLLMMLTPIAT